MARKVLIVDDEEFVRALIKDSLGSEGYELYEAPNGSEALELARNIKPDLVILDVMMPGMVGYRVCRELKNDAEMKSVFVLFLTARSGNETESTVIRSGGDDLMLKPFDPNDLRARIKAALGI